MKKIFLMTILSMVLISCGSDDNNSESFTPQDIDFSTIGQGVVVANLMTIEQQNMVVTNQTDWNQILESIPFEPEIYETDIDLNTFQVLVSIDEEKGHTGHWLEITEIIGNENNIIVTIATGEGDSGFASICRPYHIVKIPKSDKPVVFE